MSVCLCVGMCIGVCNLDLVGSTQAFPTIFCEGAFLLHIKTCLEVRPCFLFTLLDNNMAGHIEPSKQNKPPLLQGDSGEGGIKNIYLPHFKSS